MRKTPDKAFILAAGKGTRLRPYTETIPKPMLDIAGKSIIKRTIEKLAAHGVTEIVINLYHLADMLEAHLGSIKTPKIILSHETDLLETGGGIKKALHYFAGEPFYIINGDALWDEGVDGTALENLAALWNPQKMDILLMLEPKHKMILTDFVGDYDVDAEGGAYRARDKSGANMFAGVRIAHPKIFEDTPDGAFSFLQLMDRAEEQKRLYGMVLDAEWYHISTPEDLETVNAVFRKRGA